MFLIHFNNFQFPLNFDASTYLTSGRSFKIVCYYLHLAAGYGNFTFKMDFYDSSFSTPYAEKDYPLDVPLNDYIYVEYSVESSANLVIMAITCKATKDGSFYSWPQYTFLQNG